MSSFLDYLADISSGASQRDIAHIAGVEQSTVSRWKRGSMPSPESVVRLATHYGQPIPEALHHAGLITEDTAKRMRLRQSPRLSDLPHDVLLRELSRRLDRMSAPDGPITSPADYGEEPDPDDYALAAGDVARDPNDPRSN